MIHGSVETRRKGTAKMLVADNQKIVTFIRYEDSDAVQAQTVDEFTTDESFDEWVWHLAPSKEAAIAKHYSAFRS